MAINEIEGGAIVIAGSGMCNGGRIRHHLKHNVWRNNAHVIFVGYQAIGTPGRALVDGARYFRIQGEEVIVKAAIHTLGGFSAHASQEQLLDWTAAFNQPRPQTYLIHGEETAKDVLRKQLQGRDWNVGIPRFAETVSF